ncbi:MAG: hypothetical protein EBZ95_04880 [Chitinophagia bacterium]|nr:hypothetical protein [Chitinophagia bacterium]
MITSKLDANQVIKEGFDEANKALKTIGVGGTLVPEKYTSISLTYDGMGNIATVTYFNGLVQVGILTLSYDGSNRLMQVVRT